MLFLSCNLVFGVEQFLLYFVMVLITVGENWVICLALSMGFLGFEV